LKVFVCEDQISSSRKHSMADTPFGTPFRGFGEHAIHFTHRLACVRDLRGIMARFFFIFVFSFALCHVAMPNTPKGQLL
jgi:hypothetical protein